MRVILAEKPDEGRKIAQALGYKESGKGYMTLNNGDTVTWAIGHIAQFKKPNEYPQYEKWSLETLPLLPTPMDLTISPEKKDQFKVISGLVARAEEVVIATDPGREGELIARWILRLANFKGPLKRLWIDDLTPATIQKAFNNLLPGEETASLGHAAEVRAKADWIIGHTASRLFTIIAQSTFQDRIVLSSGRVQTPTLKIVYDRELAIESFKTQLFYEIHTDFVLDDGRRYSGKWFTMNGQERLTRFNSKEKAAEVLNSLGKEGKVSLYDEKTVERKQPQLFDTTSLKDAALKSLKFGIEQTGKVAQSLYDNGFITYTRTSSRHLTENAAEELQNRLGSLQSYGSYIDWFPKHLRNIKADKRFVDNNKSKEHHAIVPTDKNPKGLTSDEKSLYELILKQTLAAFYEVGKDKEVNIVTNIDNQTFYTKGTTVKEIGWRKLLGNAAKENYLPPTAKDEKVTIQNYNITEGNTEPPKRLSEAALEKAMENAGKIIETDDAEMEALLKEHGLGTPATRTGTISKLKKQNYIEVKSNLVYLSNKGRHLISLIEGNPLTSIEMTGEWEKKLSEIENNQVNPKDVLNQFIKFSQRIVNERHTIIDSMAKLKGEHGNVFAEEKEDLATCPSCQGKIIERKTFYGCLNYQANDCHFTLPKTFFGRELSPSIIKKLCDGKSLLVNGFKGQYGDYSLILEVKEGKIQQRKPSMEELSLGPCPNCSKGILEKESFYGCSGYKEGCKFTLPKSILKKAITPAQIKKLLTSGKTGLIKGFQSKDKTFDAQLSYDKSNSKIVFHFPQKQTNKKEHYQLKG